MKTNTPAQQTIITGVTLTGLTISGGVYALRGHPGSAFTGNNLVVEGASTADVLLNHAVVTLNTSTIQNSAGTGIDVVRRLHPASFSSIAM